MSTRLWILLLVLLSPWNPAAAGPTEQRIEPSESILTVDYPGIRGLRSYFGRGAMDDSYTWQRATWAFADGRVSVIFAEAKPWSGFDDSISIGQEIRGQKVFGDAQELTFHETWTERTRLGEGRAAGFRAVYGNGRWECAALLWSKTPRRLTAYVCETSEVPLPRETLQRLLAGIAVEGLADSLEP